MAVAVVDLLEAVHVHHEHAERALARAHALEGLGVLEVEPAAHVEPAQGIDVHELVEAAVELLLDGVVEGELEDRLAQEDLVAFAQRARVHAAAVHEGAVAAAHVQHAEAPARYVHLHPRVPARDARVADGELRLVRVAAQHEIRLVQ